MLKFNPFKSLTVWGVVGVITTTLVSHFDPTALSATADLVLKAAGALVATLGVRNAIAKAVITLIEGLASK